MTGPSVPADHPELVGLVATCQGAWVQGGIGKIPCTRPAVYQVGMHMLDRCNQPGLTDRGNRLFLCCADCVTRTAERVSEMIAELFELVPDQIDCPACDSATIPKGKTCVCGYTATVRCQTCAKSVAALHDLYEVEAL